jgi:hypothetical protein
VITYRVNKQSCSYTALSLNILITLQEQPVQWGSRLILTTPRLIGAWHASLRPKQFKDANKNIRLYMQPNIKHVQTEIREVITHQCRWNRVYSMNQAPRRRDTQLATRKLKKLPAASPATSIMLMNPPAASRSSAETQTLAPIMQLDAR